MDIALILTLSTLVSIVMYLIVGRLSGNGKQTGYYYVRKLEEENEQLKDRVRELEELAADLQREIATLHRQHIAVLRQLNELRSHETQQERAKGCDITVVAVWPDGTGLDLESEQRALYDAGINVVPVFGALTRASIVNAVKSAKPDILQISSHGSGENLSAEVGYDPAVVQVADGITSGWLLNLLSKSSVRLLALMNCSSVELARSVVGSNAVDAAVATTRDINDADAVAFVAEFYKMLCSGETVRSAFETARLVLPLSGYQSVILVGDGNFTLGG